jgi:5'-nucleotidase
MKKTYKILLTNDDGIFSLGLEKLYYEMKKIGKVLVIAPNSERSGTSHCVTVSEDVCVEKYFKNGEFFGYAVSGTPVDCVKIGIMELMPKNPDLVVSGINIGENTGLNILYSGTVSAAAEGTILGVPSIAISLGNGKKGDFKFAAKIAKKIALKVLMYGLPKGTFLNVNIPPVLNGDVKGVSITRQGDEKLMEYYVKKKENLHRKYYKLVGKKNKINNKLKTDESAVNRMEISITPICYNMTDYNMIEKLKKWDISI